MVPIIVPPYFPPCGAAGTRRKPRPLSAHPANKQSRHPTSVRGSVFFFFSSNSGDHPQQDAENLAIVLMKI